MFSATQTCLKLAALSPIATYVLCSAFLHCALSNVTMCLKPLQSMCSAQVWGCSCPRLIDGNSVVAPVDIIGACHALSILPQYCQFSANVANTVRLDPKLSNLTILSILHQCCQYCKTCPILAILPILHQYCQNDKFCTIAMLLILPLITQLENICSCS